MDKDLCVHYNRNNKKCGSALIPRMCAHYKKERKCVTNGYVMKKSKEETEKNNYGQW